MDAPVDGRVQYPVRGMPSYRGPALDSLPTMECSPGDKWGSGQKHHARRCLLTAIAPRRGRNLRPLMSARSPLPLFLPTRPSSPTPPLRLLLLPQAAFDLANIVSVGSSTQDDARAFFSNYGV